QDPWVSINPLRFNFQGDLVIHSASMNGVRHLKASNAYFTHASQLVAEFIAVPFLLGSDMRKHAIALAFPDIEGFSISGVNESVDIGLEFAHYLWRKRFDLLPLH